MLQVQEVLETQTRGLMAGPEEQHLMTSSIGGDIKYTLTPSIIQSIFAKYLGGK
jgi:hypothetical protein